MKMELYTVQTNFGAYAVPPSVKIVIKSAKRRDDGTLDRRTAAYRFLMRYQHTAELVARAAYVQGISPKMPEASDIP